MYVELMEQAIREAKGEPAEAVEPELNLGLAAYIPEKYIPDTEQRLVWYRRLSSTREMSVLDDAETELIDRYGSPPPEVENLLLSIQLKMVLRRIAAHKLEIGRDGLTVTFGPSGPADMDKLIDLVQSRPDEARLSPEGRLFLALSGLDDPAGLVAAKNILQGLG
jgi:transcription-repair coupling factor (superfamily II helicase)